jgi:uncharacterized protein (DUF362 family)
MPQVIITQNDDISQAIKEALGFVDLETMVKGSQVAVKTNETWASAKDTTAVTQPDTLQAVLQAIKPLSPKELIVTGGAGAGETDEIFKIAGLMDVVEKEEVTFFDHNRPPFVEVKLEYAPEKDVQGRQQSVMVNPMVFEYEKLIVVSQLKVHSTATVTLALKNIAMSYPAADYYGHPRGNEDQPHHFFDDMHSFIAAMSKRFPIDLAITVGHPAMIGQGPIGGKTFETGIVIVSTDAVAADTVGARLLGYKAEAVGHLKEASALGVGEIDLDIFTYPALSLDEAIKIFSEKAYGKTISRHHP